MDGSTVGGHCHVRYLLAVAALLAPPIHASCSVLNINKRSAACIASDTS